MSRIDEKRFKALKQDWNARFDFNAMCALEEETRKGIYEFLAPMVIQLNEKDAADPSAVLKAVSALKMSDLRLVIYHALSGHHDVSPEDVGDIIEDIGMAKAMQIVGWAFQRAMPTKSNNEAEEGGATSSKNPPSRAKRRKPAAKPG